jgi:serine/threonine protein phosphatase PrpC
MIDGVNVSDKAIKEKIYQRYVESFEAGVYNYIKEEYDPASQTIIPRKYFSGGMEMLFDVDHAMTVTHDRKRLEPFAQQPLMIASADIVPRMDDAAMVADPGRGADTPRPSVTRAKDFADRLTEIYQFTKTPLVIRYALQAVGDFQIDVQKEFQSHPDIARWILAVREEFADFVPFEGQFAVSPQKRPVDVMFTQNGDAILVTGQGQTGKGSLVKALNDIGWSDSLKVGGEDYTIVFYAQGHAFAATYNDDPNDVRLERSPLSTQQEVLKAKFQARAFDDKDFVDVSWTYRVGRVNCIVNMEKHQSPTVLGRTDVINVYNNVMAENTSSLPETLSFINDPKMPFQEALKVVKISHNVTTPGQYVNIAKQIYENVVETDLIAPATPDQEDHYRDLRAASGSERAQKQEDTNHSLTVKRHFSQASVFGTQRAVQEDESVNVVIRLPEDVPNGRGRFMAVMDGHSGKRTALLVKERIAHYFRNAMTQTNGDVEEALRFLFQELNHVTKNEKSGTTLSVVYLPHDVNKAYVAVIGDSPVIIRDKDGNVHFSPMHNAALSPEERQQAQARGAVYRDGYLIKELEGENWAALELTRSLGDSLFDRDLSREPEIYSLDLNAQSYILLATDGIFDAIKARVDDQQQQMTQLMDEGVDAKRIVDDAVLRKTNDNVTAIVMTPQESADVRDPQSQLKEMVARWKTWSPSGDILHPRQVIRNNHELFAAVLARKVPAAIIPIRQNDPLQQVMMSEAFESMDIYEVPNLSGGSDLVVGRQDNVDAISRMLMDKMDGTLILDKDYKRKIGTLLGYPSVAYETFLSASEEFFQNEKELLQLGWQYVGDFLAYPGRKDKFLYKAWALDDQLIAIDGDEMVLGPRELPWQEEQVRPVSLEEVEALTAEKTQSQTGEDFAMTAGERDVGGIDLNANALDIETRGQGVRLYKDLDYEKLLNAPIHGFYPVLIELKPIVNPPFTLNIAQ